MVFAHLCLNQHETVINFLDTVDVRGQNGLQIVLTAWLLNHADFQGLYHQKVRYVSRLVVGIVTHGHCLFFLLFSSLTMALPSTTTMK